MTETTNRFLVYAAVVDRVMDEIARTNNRAAIISAGIRELRNFPEFREATVLLTNEIEVTGQTPFDQLLKKELCELETYLLELGHD